MSEKRQKTQRLISYKCLCFLLFLILFNFFSQGNVNIPEHIKIHLYTSGNSREILSKTKRESLPKGSGSCSDGLAIGFSQLCLGACQPCRGGAGSQDRDCRQRCLATKAHSAFARRGKVTATSLLTSNGQRQRRNTPLHS